MSEPEPGGRGDFVVVFRARDLFEARLVAGFLESHGIQALIPQEGAVEAFDGVATIWHGGIAVATPAHQAERARMLVAAREGDPG